MLATTTAQLTLIFTMLSAALGCLTYISRAVWKMIRMDRLEAQLPHSDNRSPSNGA